MMKKRILLLLLSTTGSIASVLGQAPALNSTVPDQKLLPSLSGGLNGDVRNIVAPSLFDGTTNVNIPIYNFSNDYGNFGVALTYNTKGVPVSEMSGPVGLHWSLNAGGIISRAVKDIPDDVSSTFLGIGGNTIYYIGREAAYQGETPASYKLIDQLNDDYIVSAGNLHFTFKLGKDGYIFTQPASRAKITKYVPSGALTGDYGFKIRDVDGTEYVFDISTRSRATIATGKSDAPSASLTYISAWKLRSIHFPNGDAITYDYVDVSPYGADFIMMYVQRRLTAPNTVVSAPSSGSLTHVSDVQADDGGYMLKEIHYPNNKNVIFDFDQSPPGTPPQIDCSQSIKDITIQEGSNCMKYRLSKVLMGTGGQLTAFTNQCDFNESPTGGLKKLLLTGINTLNCDETQTEPYYSFEYSTADPYGCRSSARDFFDFAKLNTGGTAGNDVPVVPHPFDPNTILSGNDKSAASDISAMMMCALVKVKNAYGGSMSFEYEKNTGLVNVIDNLPVNDPLFVGLNMPDGLRLKSITSEDKYYPGRWKKTTYTYSGGQFFLNGGYFSYPSQLTNGAISEYTITNTWISPHQFINGSNHGYSNVTEETRDNNNNLLSKTTYNFQNFKDGNELRYLLYGNAATKHYYELPYTDKQYLKDWEIGLPKQIVRYDQNGNMVIRTTNYYHSEISYAIEAGLGKNINLMRVRPPDNTSINVATLPVIAADTFLPYAGISLLDSTITENFTDQNTATKDIVSYSYDDFYNRAVTRTKNSKGETFDLINIYNYNVAGPQIYGSAPGNALYDMSADGLEIEVGMEVWKKGVNANELYPTNDLLKDASITKYTYDPATKIRKLQKLDKLVNMSMVGYTDYTGITMGSPLTNRYQKVLQEYATNTVPSYFKPATEVMQWNNRNNPVETKLGEFNVYKAMLWNSNNGKLSAQANCRINEMAFSGFENADHGNWNYNENNVIDAATVAAGKMDGARILKIVSTEANPLYISGLTPGKEYLIGFWLNGGTPALSGAGLSNITLTTTYVVGNGWTYCQARFTPVNTSPVGFAQGAPNTPFIYYVDDARIAPVGSSMQCTNYIPLWGAGSTIDPTGRITTYEYDAFGRLIDSKNQEGAVLSKKEYHVGQ